MFIINAIKKIKNSKRLLFTTPTHLKSGVIPAGLKTLIGKKAYSADFSEVEGLDNFKNPQNCIKKSQEWASKIYKTKYTFYLVNGASSGIVASMLTILNEKDKVLISRNVHESVFNGLVLTGAIPVWFLPEYDSDFDISKGITLSQIKEEYKKNSDIKAIILTSPTYEGLCSEIKEIASFCKEKKIYLIVDEAHGALFPFSEKLPESAISQNADIIVHSLHKNSPSLTGTALLHIGKNSNLDVFKIQQNLNLINSTSPSWLLIASIEGAISFLNSKRCKKEINELSENIENLKSQNKDFKFLNNDDKTKLFIAKEGFCGEDISEFLFDNNIEDELTTNIGVLCLCGIGTTKKKIKKLSHILSTKKNQLKNKFSKQKYILDIPQRKLTPKEAMSKKHTLIEKEKSAGKIIAENITPYPPCVAILMAGEVIEEKHLPFLNDNVHIISD